MNHRKVEVCDTEAEDIQKAIDQAENNGYRLVDEKPMITALREPKVLLVFVEQEGEASE